MKDVKLSQKLTESALMLALATILSIIKIAALPYGGAITFACMLPMVIVSYRYGFRWGALAGFAFALLQMLFDLHTLSYATSFIAAVAIIMLDYILAFMTTSLGALFNRVQNSAAGLSYAALCVCVMRYIFHVISGCTVWAGLSIPTSDALLYSMIYNVTYMLPETIITVVAAIYVGSLLDFRSVNLKPAKAEYIPIPARILSAVSGFVALGAVAAVIAVVFPHLQNADTGEFDITGITGVDANAVLVIAAVAAVVILTLMLIRGVVKNNARKD